MQFIEALQPRLLSLANGALQPEALQRTIVEAYQQLPLPQYGPVPVEALDLQLVFRHDCM